jgi:hypothetical protein
VKSQILQPAKRGKTPSVNSKKTVTDSNISLQPDDFKAFQKEITGTKA